MRFKQNQYRHKNMKSQNFKREVSVIAKDPNFKAIQDDSNKTQVISKSDRIGQQIAFLRRNVIDLSGKLKKRLDACLQQEEIHDVGFGVYVKLVNSIHKLIITERSLEDNTTQEEGNVMEEDELMLEEFITKWLPGPDSNQRPSG